MSLSIIPLVILGQITEASVNDDASLYQVTFKDIKGNPLYGVTAVWTNEQAEIKALAAQKPYGVWINPIDGTFNVKFAGYTYTGSTDLTDPNVLAGITPIEFNNEAAGGGSGDFSTATITVKNTSKLPSNLLASCAFSAQDIVASMPNLDIRASSETDFTVILYKGHAVVNFVDSVLNYSGAITPLGEGFMVSGDCQVTISNSN